MAINFFNSLAVGTNVLYVDTLNDRVGIGTSTPDTNLHVLTGTGSGQIKLTSQANTQFQFYGNGNQDINYGSPPNFPLPGGDAVGQIRYSHGSNYMAFKVNNSERLRIGNVGQIGIGGANYGTSGQVLTSSGSSSAPSWQTPAIDGSGTLNYFAKFTPDGDTIGDAGMYDNGNVIQIEPSRNFNVTRAFGNNNIQSRILVGAGVAAGDLALDVKQKAYVRAGLVVSPNPGNVQVDNSSLVVGAGNNDIVSGSDHCLTVGSGNQIISDSDRSVSFGNNNETKQSDNSMNVGNTNLLKYSNNSHIIGQNNKMGDDYQSGTAGFNNSLVIGSDNLLSTDDGSPNPPDGGLSFVIGHDNDLTHTQTNSFTFGYSTANLGAHRNDFNIGGDLTAVNQTMTLGYRNDTTLYPTIDRNNGLGVTKFVVAVGSLTNSNANALLITEGGITAGGGGIVPQIPRVILPTVPTFSASNDAAADTIGIPEGGLYQNGGVVQINRGGGSTTDPLFDSVGISEYIYHIGDTDTKIGFVANDNFAITTAGVERVRVTSGGSVGIATNNPSAKLDVEGNAVIGAAGNTVSGDFAVAINKNTVVTSEDGFAQGENTIATGRQAAAFGFNTYANGAASIAGGSLSETNAQRSIAVGATAITNAEDSAAFNAGTRANGLFSFATGQGCFATNNAAFATGSNTQATGLYSFSGGVNSIASGNGAVAFGGGAQCSGEFSFAAGNINVASGVNSTALGFDNDAIGAHSTVIGHLNTTSAAAAYGVAINFQNTVSGQAAFAFNQGNTVSGLNAAAGGVSNTVDAEGSFAYGFGNDTAGAGATPPQQILLGRFLKPPRDAAGNAGEAQIIVGRHNAHANQNATAFAVGTGTAANATRSSLKVYYDNTVTLADNVTVNSSYSYFNQPIRIGANAAANELDDYEEGTFDLEWGYAFMGGIVYYDINDFGGNKSESSRYVKIGRHVTVTSTFGYGALPTAWTSSNATVYFKLPFTVGIGYYGNGAYSSFPGSNSSIAGSPCLYPANYSYADSLLGLHRSTTGFFGDFQTLQVGDLPGPGPSGRAEFKISFSFYTTD